MTMKTTMAIAVAAMASAHIVFLPRGAHSFSTPTTTPHRRCCRRNDDGLCHTPPRIPTTTIAECRRGRGGRIANRNRRSGRGGGGGGEAYDDGDMEEEDASGTARPVGPPVAAPGVVAADDVIDVNLDDRGHGIRLNKVFKATHSRRMADELIRSGRVCVNGVVMTGSRDDAGTRVVPYRDVVTLDGVVVRGWEVMNAVVPVLVDDGDDGDDVNIDVDRAMSYVVATEGDGEEIARDGDDRGHRRRLILRRTTSSFEYVKYHKPTGVTCTTDPRIKDNIVDSIRRSGYVPRHRVYPVGRLDRETSGLILLTSDGRVVNSVLRGERKQPKVYEVRVDGTLRDDDIRRLRVSLALVFFSPSFVRRWHPFRFLTRRRNHALTPIRARSRNRDHGRRTPTIEK
jgi:16S rRNA U516 pseudouridylate synthase RsuA-like enzyme